MKTTPQFRKVQDPKVTFDYYLIDKYEAGMSLSGTQTRSIRDKSFRLSGAFVEILSGQAYLVNLSISNTNNKIRLLLNRHEIDQIEKSVVRSGMTCVPVSLYEKDGRFKLEIATAKGKNIVDKRQSIKEKDNKRQLSRTMRR